MANLRIKFVGVVLLKPAGQSHFICAQPRQLSVATLLTTHPHHDCADSSGKHYCGDQHVYSEPSPPEKAIAFLREPTMA